MAWAAVTSLEPEQPWVPPLDWRGAEGIGGDVSANELPLGL